VNALGTYLSGIVPPFFFSEPFFNTSNIKVLPAIEEDTLVVFTVYVIVQPVAPLAEILPVAAVPPISATPYLPVCLSMAVSSALLVPDLQLLFCRLSII